MNNECYTCHVCDEIASSIHHIIKRSKVPALIKCPHNQVKLCTAHHYSLHHGSGQELEERLRREFLNYLQISFLKDYIEYKDIKEVLNISDKPLRGILKIVKQKNGEYERRSLIFELMGGYLLNSEEI